jgi:hypothetical protein
MAQLIRCVNCDQVFHRTAFDQMPEYDFSSKSPDPFQGVPRDDYQDFLEHHRGHRMEDLRIIEDSFVSEKSYIEPVKTSYFKATNGKEKFVIRRFRKNITDPLKYDLIYGDIALKCLKVEAQTIEIRKQMKREFADRGSEEQIQGFVSFCQRLAERAEIENLTRMAEDSSHPLEIYYRMDDVSYATLLRNCRKLFPKEQFQAIQEFVDRHRDDGVLLLKATYEIELTETGIRRTAPAQVSVGKKAMVKKE